CGSRINCVYGWPSMRHLSDTKPCRPLGNFFPVLGHHSWNPPERTSGMMRATCSVFAALLLFQGLAGPARAGDAPATPYVVLVGVDKYADKQIKSRTHAEADAQALYDLFVSKEHLGVEAKNIKLLLGSTDKKRSSEPATKLNILKAINWLATTANKDDRVIFPFFAQGAPLGGRACYFASDSTVNERAKNAI